MNSRSVSTAIKLISTRFKTFYGTTQNAVYTQIWIAVCDYLLLIIAKKHYGLVPSLHSSSNSIGQVLFERTDIRELYNQSAAPVVVPEAGSVVQLTILFYLWIAFNLFLAYVDDYL